MNETSELGRSFESAEEPPSHQETESERSNTPISVLAEKLNRIDESRFGDDLDHLEQERRLVEIRATWLKIADEHYKSGEYVSCLILMKDIIRDIQISNDLTHLDEAMSIRDELYAQLGRKGGRLFIKQVSPETDT